MKVCGVFALPRRNVGAVLHDVLDTLNPGENENRKEILEALVLLLSRGFRVEW